MNSIIQRLKGKNESFMSSFNLQKFTDKRRKKETTLRRKTRLQIHKNQRKMKISLDSIDQQEMISICPQVFQVHLNPEQRLQSLFFYFQSMKDPCSVLKLLQVVQKLSQPPFKIRAQDFIKSGLLQILIQISHWENLEHLRLVSLICLNIASGNQETGQAMVEYGAVESCKQMIQSYDNQVSQNCLWCLANLAANGFTIKQILIYQGILELFIEFCDRSDTPLIPEICLRGISSLIKGKAILTPQQIQICISLFKKSIGSYFKDIVSYTLLGIEQLSLKGNKILHQLIQHSFLPLILKLLENKNQEIALQALKILNNFAASEDSQIPDTLFQLQILQYFQYFIQHKKESIRKQCYHTLCNLAAGKKQHSDYIVKSPIIEFCMKGFTDFSHKVRVQASLLFYTITQTGIWTTCMDLLAKGLVKYLIKGLNQNIDPDLIFKLLQTCKNMLNAGAQQAYLQNSNNFVLEIFVKEGFLPVKDCLHYYENKEISSMVDSIELNYFSGNELFYSINSFC